MKVLWFHLMPYQELPENFKQKHNSVWVDIDPKLFDPLKGHKLYNEYIDELVYADQVASTVSASTSIIPTATG